MCTLAEAWRFYASIDWYLELFIIPSTLNKSPVPAEEKQPRSISCHHHVSLWVWCSYGNVLCCFVPNIPFRIMTKNFNLGFIRPWHIFPHAFGRLRNSCSSFNVAVVLLAASLASFLLIFSSILEGHPLLGNITVAPYFLHLMMTVFTVFHGISNALEILLYPSPDWYLSTMRSLWGFGSSLWTMAFAVRCD